MYEKMYHTLFNAATEAIEKLEAREYQSALLILEKAQKNTETLYCQGETE